MGASANFKVSLDAVYPRTLDIEIENTEEEVTKFLEKYKGYYGRKIRIHDEDEVTMENLESKKYLGFIRTSGEDEWSTMSEYAKDNFDYEFGSVIDEDGELYAVKPMTIAELQKMNLEILSEYEFLDDINVYINLADIYGLVYADSDNDYSEKVSIPKNIMNDIINKKCYLLLGGTGDSYY